MSALKHTNLNQRLIKTPKPYFEDVGLAARFQGWTDYQPLFVSPAFGHLFENLVLIEIERFFQNSGQAPKIFFLRSKEKVEVDFLVGLSNQRWLAVEAKATAVDFSPGQLALLGTTGLTIVERWVVSASSDDVEFRNCRVVSLESVHRQLSRHG